MNRRHLFFLATLLAGLIWLSSTPLRTAAGGQKNPDVTPVPVGAIKSESSMVLVDVVVTDKKKRFLKDLTQKEFQVFEDGTEQPVVSLTREGDIRPDSPGRQRYMVLFFDNSSTNPEFQMIARDAARKFVEMAASPNRMMAVVDFDNGLHVPLHRFLRPGIPLVAVNFKLPADKLKYRLEVWGRDSEGNVSGTRSGIFTIE